MLLKCEGPHQVSRCNFRGQSRSSSHRPQPAKSQFANTYIIVDRLDFLLSGYNHSIVEFPSSGFREGFPLHYDGVRHCSDANNLISALENPDVVDAKIKKELDAGHLAGPFIGLALSPHFGFLH